MSWRRSRLAPRSSYVASIALFAIGSLIISYVNYSGSLPLLLGILGGLILGLGALLYGVTALALVSLTARNGALAFSIVLLLLAGGSYVLVPGWVGDFFRIWLLIMFGSHMVSWVYYLAMGPEAVVGKEVRRVRTPRLLKGIGVGVLVIVLVLIAVIGGAYFIAGSSGKPILAGDKVIVPGRLRPVSAEEVVKKIVVNPRNYASEVYVSKRALKGLFKGDLENPIGSIVKTTSGTLRITSRLVSRIEIKEINISPPKFTLVQELVTELVSLLASTAGILSFLTDFRLLMILTGIALYALGSSLSRG